MAIQVWFLRHGEAVPHDAKPDFDRELTPRGERQSQAAGRGLGRSGVDLTTCYTSPRVRARQTAALACGDLGVSVEVAESLSSGFGVDDLTELLHAHDDDARILLVGHEPDFSQTIHDLTGATIDMKKGGIAAVKLTGSGSAELIALLRPRELEALAQA